MYDGTRLRAEVQGWIQETVLLDAGEMLLAFFRARQMGAMFVNVSQESERRLVVPPSGFIRGTDVFRLVLYLLHVTFLVLSNPPSPIRSQRPTRTKSTVAR